MEPRQSGHQSNAQGIHRCATPATHHGPAARLLPGIRRKRHARSDGSSDAVALSATQFATTGLERLSGPGSATDADIDAGPATNVQSTSTGMEQPDAAVERALSQRSGRCDEAIQSNEQPVRRAIEKHLDARAAKSVGAYDR